VPHHPLEHRRVVLFLVIIAAVVAITTSDAVHDAFVDVLAIAERLMRAYPRAGMVLFIALSALSAMLSFFSSSALVPVGVFVWGSTTTMLLLWSGGVLGGIAGLSGVLMSIWCGLRGWSADRQRGIYQPYNLIVLSIALGIYASQGLLTPRVWELSLFCLPATLLGTWLGLRLYGRVNDRQFRYLVLWLLLASGLVLTLSSLA